jgi:DNA repair ATPase RecN
MSEKTKHGLKELQNELKQINSEDPKLQKLAGEIDAALEQTGEVSRTLAHSLQHTAEEFEVHHPQLTAIINNIMNSLSGLGI